MCALFLIDELFSDGVSQTLKVVVVHYCYNSKKKFIFVFV